jgi:DNA primase
MQFDLDHEDMIRLIQEQRHELDELHHRAEQQQLRSAGSKQDHRVRVTRDIIPNDKQNNEDVVLDVEAVDDDQSSSTGSSSSKQSNTEGRRRRHGHGPPPPSPQSHFHHQHRPQPHVRKPFMQPDAAFVTGESFGDLTPPMMSYHEVHIMDLERRLHLALEENAMLMEQLLTQRHMYDDERAELEQRIMEEQERVLSLQEELTMERTYFQQAQVELQDLVDTQRKRADRLQDELMIREMQDQQRMFQHQQQHYQHQNGGNTRTHYTQSGAAAASAESHHHHHRGGGAGNGVYVGSADPHDRFNIQLDMNDIRSPLFP